MECPLTDLCSTTSSLKLRILEDLGLVLLEIMGKSGLEVCQSTGQINGLREIAATGNGCFGGGGKGYLEREIRDRIVEMQVAVAGL